jgi:flagellar biosynthesis/type III secretory pathway protein FliH
MAKMQIAPDERAKVKLECLRLMLTLKLDPARMQMISGFIDSYLKLGAHEHREFLTAMEREPLARREKAMELIGNWMEEGIQKGLQRGRQEGRQEGESALVMRLLNRRVGPLTKRLEKRVRALPVEQLENLGEALLDFQSRAELERWLEEHTQK